MFAQIVRSGGDNYWECKDCGSTCPVEIFDEARIRYPLSYQNTEPCILCGGDLVLRVVSSVDFQNVWI